MAKHFCHSSSCQIILSHTLPHFVGYRSVATSFSWPHRCIARCEQAASTASALLHAHLSLLKVGGYLWKTKSVRLSNARQAIAELRQLRGFFGLFRRTQDECKPNYNHVKDGKRATLITVFVMNMSHVIPKFSFGKHFPEITQPLLAFQEPLLLIVTHYERQLKPHSGVPGIFFKFDIEPVRLILIQCTTTFAQFFIRCVTSLSHLLTISYLYPICVGVIDGISVCASWGLRVTDRMISVVAGPDDTGSIAPPSSARSCLRCNWTGSVLRARSTNPSPRPGISAERGRPAARPTAASQATPAGSYSPYSTNLYVPGRVNNDDSKKAFHDSPACLDQAPSPIFEKDVKAGRPQARPGHKTSVSELARDLGGLDLSHGNASAPEPRPSRQSTMMSVVKEEEDSIIVVPNAKASDGQKKGEDKSNFH
ncbi:hypothetical protein EI94DRAFT_1878050 [Lactarius quietus]|nr:hypothetical protein EI94DRAFT_1878050 [Lactarius quietus]